MQFISYLKSKLPFYVALSFTFILASCGSYQYVGYDNDGIYGSEDVVYEQQSYNETPAGNNNNYYKNYFAEKSRQFENVSEDGAVFTDIDSYEGDYNEVEDTTYVSGYSGWGQDNGNVTVNVYSNYGYSNWYRPYAWNWYRPYYGFSYYGYDPYWYSPFYGYYGYSGYYGGFSYYSPYWYGHHRNHNYYNSYYGSRNIAYNAGRRGSLANSTYRTSNYSADRTSSLNRRSSSTLSRSNSTISRPRSSTFSSTARRGQNSAVRPRINSNNRNNNSTVRPRVNSTTRPNTTTRSNSTPRRSNNNNSSSSINRSSSRSSSSSGSNISSGPSRSSSSSSSSRSSSSRRGNQ